MNLSGFHQCPLRSVCHCLNYHVDISLKRGREFQEGGDICILKADSHCHKEETNATL